MRTVCQSGDERGGVQERPSSLLGGSGQTGAVTWKVRTCSHARHADCTACIEGAVTGWDMLEVEQLTGFRMHLFSAATLTWWWSWSSRQAVHGSMGCDAFERVDASTEGRQRGVACMQCEVDITYILLDP